MAKYSVEVGYMVPHWATIVIEADNCDDAERLALDQALEMVPDYSPDNENGGPLQIFDSRRALPSEDVTYPDYKVQT